MRETPTEVAGGHYARLNSVATPGVARAVFESLGQPFNVLLQFTDSSVFGLRPVPASLSLLDELAPATGDWPQHSTRGLVFAEGDEPVLAEWCEYVLAEGASAYLYAPSVALTIGFWESEFMELWCPEAATINAVVQRLALHAVREMELDS